MKWTAGVSRHSYESSIDRATGTFIVRICVAMQVRAAELKHARVAMLAVVGWAWTATGTHFEGQLSYSAGVTFADVAALGPLLGAAKVPGAGIWQMISAIGALEIYWENKYPATECAGDFGVPRMTQDPEKLKVLSVLC